MHDIIKVFVSGGFHSVDKKSGSWQIFERLPQVGVHWSTIIFRCSLNYDYGKKTRHLVLRLTTLVYSFQVFTMRILAFIMSICFFSFFVAVLFLSFLYLGTGSITKPNELKFSVNTPLTALYCTSSGQTDSSIRRYAVLRKRPRSRLTRSLCCITF